jgi:nucleoside-diphosphate-sugar epimerase
MAKTAFVTGSTGFLGLNLIEQLVAQDWNVVALHRPGSDLRYLRRFPVTAAQGDINDTASLARTMPRNVDAVFHVAGDTNTWSRRNEEQNRVNIDGTRNVVNAALASGAKRFVLTSSISAYGIHEGKIDEAAEKLGGASWINYQRSKFFGEEEARKGMQRGLDPVILNPACILGPYGTSGWSHAVELIYTGKLRGIPSGGLSYCHSREVARAHIAAAERGRSGENYLLGGHDATFLELTRTIAEVVERPAPSRAIPAAAIVAAGRLAATLSFFTGRPPSLTPEMAGMVTRKMYCDCSKAERELGYRPAPLREMIEDNVRWLKQEGILESWGSTA